MTEIEFTVPTGYRGERQDIDEVIEYIHDTPNRRIEHVTLLEGIASPLNKMLLARRQALLIELGAIEECLGMERSVIPKHKR